MIKDTAEQKKLSQKTFLETKQNRLVLVICLIIAVIYFVFITFYFKQGNPVLFGLLILGEVFHLWQVIGYVQTIWRTDYKAPFTKNFEPDVDILIPVVSEPVEIVEETVIAAKNMNYSGKINVYICNDGFVANKDNWREYEELAQRQGVTCITRQIPGGAKAGNINFTLRSCHSEYFAIFDCDQVPKKNFLKEMMGFFGDPKMGFVQSPQYYKNYDETFVAGGAWEQQALFFGAILKGKNRLNSVFMCGTNMVLRREMLNEVGGMCESNIAEDFLTSLFVHEKGWKSTYVPKVLAEGLAPEDFLSYYKQQYRWARGSLEVIFKYNPLFRKGLTFTQKIQYLSAASYYLSGVVILIDAMLPLAFLYTGAVPLVTSTMVLAGIFIPYIVLNLFILQMSCNFTFTYRALSFSLSSFALQLKAIYAILINQQSKFAVTSKKKLTGNFYNLVTPHFVYFGVAGLGIVVALMREGVTASFVTNASWVLIYLATFLPFIVAASPAMQFKVFRKIGNIFSSKVRTIE